MLKDVNRKIDFILMNPPFSGRYHERFLLNSLYISNILISIQPLSYLYSKKQNKKITEKLDKCYVYVDLINVNNYFNIDSVSPTGIIYADMQKDGDIHIFDKIFNKCEDVKLWSIDDYLVKFFNNLGDVNNSLHDHIKIYNLNNKNEEDDELWCVRIPRIRGHIDTTKNNIKDANDFYTVISNNDKFINKNKGKFKILKTIPTRRKNNEFAYFAFNTEQELNNFINYLKTDFLRTCLMLMKVNFNLIQGEMKYIPWFDFSDEHFNGSPREIDNYLFKKYNISDDIRQYLEKKLPDIYHIRN